MPVPGLDPGISTGIHELLFLNGLQNKTWTLGTSPRLSGLFSPDGSASTSVMTGRVPVIHELLFSNGLQNKTWIPGTRPGMTN